MSAFSNGSPIASYWENNPLKLITQRKNNI